MGSLSLSCANLVLITLKSVQPGLKPVEYDEYPSY